MFVIYIVEMKYIHMCYFRGIKVFLSPNMHKMYVYMHLVCYKRCGCQLVTNLLLQIKNKLCVLAVLFTDSHSLEVITNLCFVTLIDVSKHMCELFIDLSLCSVKYCQHFNLIAYLRQ